jgi:hypothetical protein
MRRQDMSLKNVNQQINNFRAGDLVDIKDEQVEAAKFNAIGLIL